MEKNKKSTNAEDLKYKMTVCTVDSEFSLSPVVGDTSEEIDTFKSEQYDIYIIGLQVTVEVYIHVMKG